MGERPAAQPVPLTLDFRPFLSVSRCGPHRPCRKTPDSGRCSIHGYTYVNTMVPQWKYVERTLKVSTVHTDINDFRIACDDDVNAHSDRHGYPVSCSQVESCAKHRLPMRLVMFAETDIGKGNLSAGRQTPY